MTNDKIYLYEFLNKPVKFQHTFKPKYKTQST